MSDSTKNTATTGKGKSKFSLAERIIAFFKLDDAGKIDSFLIRLQRDFNNEITAINQNIASDKITFSIDMQKINEDIEDATSVVAEAWLAVKPEDVATNELQKSFKSTYLAKISSAENALEALTDAKAEVERKHEAGIAKQEKEVAKREARIAQLNS